MTAGRLWAAVLANVLLFSGVAALGPRLAAGDALPAGRPGSAVAAWKGSAPVWVMTDDDGRTVVLDAVNPHPWFGMKELVGWCPSEGRFVAFYDASHFDSRGIYVFGPAHHDLQRYRVRARRADAVDAGALMPAQGRGRSAETPAGDRQCWTDPSGTRRIPRPPEAPIARYHERVPPGYRLVEGAIVIEATGGRFCHRLLGGRPPPCAEEGVRVLDARYPFPDWDDTVVVRGRFLAREGRGGLRDVTVLPGGWTSFHPRP